MPTPPPKHVVISPRGIEHHELVGPGGMVITLVPRPMNAAQTLDALLVTERVLHRVAQYLARHKKTAPSLDSGDRLINQNQPTELEV